MSGGAGAGGGWGRQRIERRENKKRVRREKRSIYLKCQKKNVEEYKKGKLTGKNSQPEHLMAEYPSLYRR